MDDAGRGDNCLTFPRICQTIDHDKVREAIELMRHARSSKAPASGFKRRKTGRASTGGGACSDGSPDSARQSFGSRRQS